MEITIKEAKNTVWGEILFVGCLTAGAIFLYVLSFVMQWSFGNFLFGAFMLYMIGFYANAFYVAYMLKDALMHTESGKPEPKPEGMV